MTFKILGLLYCIHCPTGPSFISHLWPSNALSPLQRWTYIHYNSKTSYLPTLGSPFIAKPLRTV